MTSGTHSLKHRWAKFAFLRSVLQPGSRDSGVAGPKWFTMILRSSQGKDTKVDAAPLDDAMGAAMNWGSSQFLKELSTNDRRALADQFLLLSHYWSVMSFTAITLLSW